MWRRCCVRLTWMSVNTDLAHIFDEIAALLTLTGANPFRAQANERAARILRDMTDDVATLSIADDAKKQLTALDGIGGGTADKIIEFINTGKIAEHEELLEVVPGGLLDVLQIPGLGPKTVKVMWDKADVTSVDTLKEALAAGTIEKLPRMGAKTVQNIRDALEFQAKSSGRARLGVAMPIAQRIVEHLTNVKGVQQCQFAGSLRRGRETIGDIDILASTTKPKDIAEAFTTMAGVDKILAAGETKCSVRIDEGIQVDLRVVDDKAFGAALLYFTGSKEHNVRLRERAIKQKLRLNEYGLFPNDDDDTPPQSRGVKPVACKTEADIYAKLDLQYIPPELREDRGELDADIPRLVEVDDIKAELHAHTTASDGKFTIEELITEAQSRGYHTIAITDHSKSSAQANGLDEKRLRAHIQAIRTAAKQFKTMNVLCGSEVDIRVDGTLDYDDKMLGELDIVVASPHASLAQEPKKATTRLVAAVSHPMVHVLGHPTGRLINSREGLSPDMNAIIAAAVEHDTALEINANFMRLDLRDTHVRAAVEAGCKIAINTDAHAAAHIDFLRYGVLTGRRGWLTPELCINTWSKAKLATWLKLKRQ